MSDQPTRYLPQSRRFPTTRWSLVREACRGESGAGADASLETIYVSYWYPLYAWARHSGWNEDDGRDLIQGFFERLIEKKFLDSAEAGKGKLRSFLLVCLKRYAKDLREKARAMKRDTRLTVSLDFEWAEGRYHEQQGNEQSPDVLFDQRWAHTLLHYTLEALELEMREAGKGELLDALKPYLQYQPDEDDSYSALSKKLGLSIPALKSQVFRLRKRYHDILLREVSLTLGDEADPKEELMALMVNA